MYPKKYYLEDVFNDLLTTKEVDKMKCDIYEKENDYYIEMDLPGFEKEEISIEMKENYLTISAAKKLEEDFNYIRKERKYNTLKRSFYIGNIKTEQIEAEYKNGILKVKIPKMEEKEETIKIEIK